MQGTWRKGIWVYSGILGAIIIGHLGFWAQKEILVKNDLEANLLQIRYIRQSGWQSNWNPYINLPVWQDPLLGYLNPFWTIPVIILPVELGVKVADFVSLLLCGLGTFFLARSLKINWQLATVAAMTFAVSGYPTARIMAGQAEKVTSLAFVPWILYLLLNKKNSWLTGFFIAMTLWSGDLYTFLYSLIIAVVLLRFREIGWALIFGLIRIWPIWQISSFIYKPIEPLVGVQNLFSIGYHLFFPIIKFWQTFGLDKWKPTEFGWWEKAAYIGPLGVFAFGTKNKRLIVIMIITIIIAIAGFRGEVFKLFHVSTRVFGYLSLIVLMAAMTKIKSKILWIINFGFCLSLTWYAYGHRQLPEIFPEMKKAVEIVPAGSLVAYDQLNYPIRQFLAQEKGIKMVATNYGFMLKNTDAELWLIFGLTGQCYKGKLPDYIIYPKDKILSCLNKDYNVYKSYSQVRVYEKINH